MRKPLPPVLAGRSAVLLCLAALALFGFAAGPEAVAARPAPPTAGPVPGAPQPPRAAVPVHIAGIHVVDPEQVLLLLADEKEERVVPIAVGRDQGIAIYLGRERTETPRPMTHDLLVSILKALGARLEKITITELRQETYIAEIALHDGKALHRIDARPSDAIALSVRLGSPIFAAPDLLRPLGGPGRPELRTKLDRRLGLTIQDLDADLADWLGAAGVQGVLVASVARGGPAERSGLRRGDIIQEVDGRPTADRESYGRATESADGQTRFGVWRDGKTLTITAR